MFRILTGFLVSVSISHLVLLKFPNTIALPSYSNRLTVKHILIGVRPVALFSILFSALIKNSSVDEWPSPEYFSAKTKTLSSNGL
ncbi:hypothetical protein DSY4343 [Desulfitobacterium hafniense Y51]|uniref:Uncharacterized protein n=1 Tax=Desulfitobacterium hafniense (strain Y51) TaxID=138119 RepID=Q24PB0_DESHY|nr:hypothetical protein DSY4343 [Desulfitobacterium hafniense Y51]